ncbi:uncharacterized protein MONOS_17855 [Monocercomonoides exilis]|uniref:uncharacterized protein n=1 Tax=Monocercomonoides exilis TaxID=2049356 RepID=UPI0035598AD7|nr:hypothetical protein MONOS_17855 [Monocercomonoides exilis]
MKRTVKKAVSLYFKLLKMALNGQRLVISVILTGARFGAGVDVVQKRQMESMQQADKKKEGQRALLWMIGFVV